MTIFRQFFRFSGVGIIGTLCHYTLLMAMVELGDLNSVVSSASGFTIGAVVNYYLNHVYTFQSSVPHRQGFPKFFTIALIGLGLNTVIMGFAVTQLRLHYLIAQVLATCSVLFWNFLANRAWTFRASL